MTTVQAAIDTVINRLEKGTSTLIDVSSGSLTNSGTTVTLTYNLAGTGIGSILEFPDGEQMYVLGESGSTRTVIRGWNNTTKVVHVDLEVIRCNPRFTRSEVAATVADELRSWPVELHRWDTVEVSIAAETWNAELTPTVSGAEVHRLLDANVQAASTANDAQLSRIDVRLLHDADKDEYASGYGIQLSHIFGEARTVQVDMVTSYDLSAVDTLATDLQTDIGVRDSLLDILYYGVMWRQMSTLEVGRTDPAASAPLDSAEVPPTHLSQTAEVLLRVRNQRMSEERTRVYDTWPLLMTTMGS